MVVVVAVVCWNQCPCADSGPAAAGTRTTTTNMPVGLVVVVVRGPPLGGAVGLCCGCGCRVVLLVAESPPRV